MTSGGSLEGRVALVTGGSRGVGKGIAEALSEAGATVYVTGRTVAETDFATECIPIPCDHTDDAQVESAFARIQSDRGRLDILANSVWGGYEQMVEGGEFTWMRPFWQQPIFRWDAMFSAGVRAYFVASRLAAEQMVKRRTRLAADGGGCHRNAAATEAARLGRMDFEMVMVKYDDLSAAFDFVSFAAPFEHQAFVSLDTGAIYWISETSSVDDEERPDDLETSDRYIAVPHKNDLDLGRSLALRFVDEQLPDRSATVRAIFQHRGAYARFKDLLTAEGQLENWYAFEAESTQRALRQWCEENQVQLAEDSSEQSA